MELLSKDCQKSCSFLTSPVLQPLPFLVDEDSGLGMEIETKSPKLAELKRKRSIKRSTGDQNRVSHPTSFKRHKSFDVASVNKINHLCPVQSLSSDTEANTFTDGNNVITGDKCALISLPTIQGKHRDIHTISTDTMRDVLSGRYDNSVDHVTIIDCRYPYEYHGGHIQNAINIYTKDGIGEFLKENQPTSLKHVLIFHCEFSSKRGPKLCRFLRSRDRELNKDNYPKLNFPEIYLLEGGYKQFFETYKDLCHPQAYKPMLDKQHSADLRHFRVKSKSWAAGDKPRYERTGLQRLKLSFN